MNTYIVVYEHYSATSNMQEEFTLTIKADSFTEAEKIAATKMGHGFPYGDDYIKSIRLDDNIKISRLQKSLLIEKWKRVAELLLDISSLWDEVDGNSNKIMLDSYPFKESLDEVTSKVYNIPYEYESIKVNDEE